MSSETVYVLHKQGADSHYTGLNYLLQENNSHLKFREFSILSNSYKAFKSLNWTKIKKQLINLGFLISLLFSKNRKILLGIAPFDHKLRILLKVLKNHRVYYHTSWACWDKSFHPKRKYNSPAVFETWRYFIETKAEHIFCVTEKTRNQLLENYHLDKKKTSVVYHALNPAFLNKMNIPKMENSFIYFGRMVSKKGIEELLSYFANKRNTILTLIGDGKQSKLVEQYARENANIVYHKLISDSNELLKILAQHEYLVLNSKQDELFGLVIIESMSQGVIPIAAALTGPKEIISPDMGFLFKEGEISTVLSEVIQRNDSKLEMAERGVARSQFYSPQNIAKRWQEILN